MNKNSTLTIVGAGPAGLMAAEILAKAGCSVTVYDRMPSPGRKLLMAGRGGLNITHSEDFHQFKRRYGSASGWLAPILDQFSSQDLQNWCETLGIQTFIGSSGRVFPLQMKASPLLRAWLKRLEQLGVLFELNQNWIGWNDKNEFLFEDHFGHTTSIRPQAVLLALGGASWPRLGANGSWFPILQQKNIPVSPLRPSNCGFCVSWSELFRKRFSGKPIKSLRILFNNQTVRGEAMIADAGIEGGIIYALSASLRNTIEKNGVATVHLDLRPDLTLEQLTQRLEKPQGRQSNSTFLRKTAGLPPISISLIYEYFHCHKKVVPPLGRIAPIIKSLPLTLTAPFSLERAISTAGGVQLEALNKHLMLSQYPGIFVAGEMLDWEAPTGGYLLQATLSTAHVAAHGMLQWLKDHSVQ